MRSRDISGVQFRPTYYTPMFGVYEGELIGGVQVHIEDEQQIDVVELGLELATAMRDQDPEKYEVNDNYNELIGSTEVRDLLRSGANVEEMKATWEDDLNDWIVNVRNQYLLYGPYPEGVNKYERQMVLGILPLDLNLAVGEESPISVHAVDRGGRSFTPHWRLIDWAIDEDVATINRNKITGVGEGVTSASASFLRQETSRDVVVAQNIIENIRFGVQSGYTRVVFDLNKTIRPNIETDRGELTVEIPYAALGERLIDGEGIITPPDNPILDQVEYGIEDDTFVAKLQTNQEDIKYETPGYSNRIVIDLFH
ncbi:exo-beta-N-acetylmuramidase NamZ domain-containing protein [Geomicrobium sp. JCM 19039]|uniref:exo-beta-N-acetylmuramidase NamZ domain-containing protein n=1 Tax=Geomicrobium sp. JCM 19039 TaxID=1460636 RepID=UPI00045F103D|nr:exo-beta-N-acetylmuramidase NamZ domain-containing protein [Geomicrobium sp. JCM 19039]GAK12741.1 YzbB protein [Geomicrobium sp. JCM 19039]